MVVHGIHMGTDTYLKKALKQIQNPSDVLYNDLVVKRGYPWGSLVRARWKAVKSEDGVYLRNGLV